MKRIGLILLLVWGKPVYSQIKTDSIRPSDVIKISLRKDAAERPLNLDIKGIDIIDSRNDTSALAFSNDLRAKTYCFKTGFRTEMTGWFSEYLKISGDSNAKPRLLVNIKKLRASNEATTKIMENGTASLEKMDGNMGLSLK